MIERVKERLAAKWKELEASMFDEDDDPEIREIAEGAFYAGYIACGVLMRDLAGIVCDSACGLIEERAGEMKGQSS